jgi:hypothetical protein
VGSRRPKICGRNRSTPLGQRKFAVDRTVQLSQRDLQGSLSHRLV